MLTPHCTICSGTYLQNDHITSTQCGHCYHNECLFQWLNTSPTCPQCRRNCPLGSGLRIYLDFADEELLATTSTRVSPIDGQPNQESEETIKVLLAHIDEDSWKNEEMDHHMAEFDARSEELSKTKSIVEEQSETSKIILTAFDSVLDENERLQQAQHEKEHENADLRLMNDNLATQLQQLQEQIRMNEHNVRVLREQLERVERESNAHQWTINLKDNDIKDLAKANQVKVTEINILCDQINQLKFSCAGHTEQINHVFSMFQSLTNQNLGAKMLQFLKPTETVAEHAQQESQDNDVRSVVPFCGSIEEWDFMWVPVIKKFSRKLK